jgi:hypothetical protein
MLTGLALAPRFDLCRSYGPCSPLLGRLRGRCRWLVPFLGAVLTSKEGLAPGTIPGAVLFSSRA